MNSESAERKNSDTGNLFCFWLRMVVVPDWCHLNKTFTKTKSFLDHRILRTSKTRSFTKKQGMPKWMPPSKVLPTPSDPSHFSLYQQIAMEITLDSQKGFHQSRTNGKTKTAPPFPEWDAGGDLELPASFPWGGGGSDSKKANERKGTFVTHRAVVAATLEFCQFLPFFFVPIFLS